VGQKFRELNPQIQPNSPSTPNSQPAHHRTGQSATRHARLVRVGVGRPPPPPAPTVGPPRSEVRLRLRGSPSIALYLLPARARSPITRLPPPGWPASIAQAPSGLGQAASCPGQVIGCLASRIDLRLRPDGIGDDEGNASGGGHCAHWLFDVLTQRRFAS
jgi:hypothetical protein